MQAYGIQLCLERSGRSSGPGGLTANPPSSKALQSLVEAKARPKSAPRARRPSAPAYTSDTSSATQPRQRPSSAAPPRTRRTSRRIDEEEEEVDDDDGASVASERVRGSKSRRKPSRRSSFSSGAPSSRLLATTTARQNYTSAAAPAAERGAGHGSIWRPSGSTSTAITPPAAPSSSARR